MGKVVTRSGLTRVSAEFLYSMTREENERGPGNEVDLCQGNFLSFFVNLHLGTEVQRKSLLKVQLNE